mgnify:CR=1 FL=1
MYTVIKKETDEAINCTTQTQVAELIGVTRITVFRIMNNTDKKEYKQWIIYRCKKYHKIKGNDTNTDVLITQHPDKTKINDTIVLKEVKKEVKALTLEEKIALAVEKQKLKNKA